MNVKTMFAWFEILNIGDHLNFIAHFGERDCAGDLTSGLRLQLRRSFRNFLCPGKTSDRAKHCYEENCFHVVNVPPF